MRRKCDGNVSQLSESHTWVLPGARELRKPLLFLLHKTTFIIAGMIAVRTPLRFLFGQLVLVQTGIFLNGLFNSNRPI